MIGRLLAALSTTIVACVLALALPVAQLQLASIENSCCCPDPDRCRCPDHDESDGRQPAMQACHNTQQAMVTPAFAAFEPPAPVHVTAAPRIATAIVHSFDTPHAPPALRRPAAPS
ncbi:MAG: hypothetical protein H0T89_09270 [Deltaproteobacteria bacterium]|nr:hypothetical protein [Deltaproteobacteria bacterium]MDQ3295944.1 hypothetical protein [Myxococcota bacterium]